MASSLPSIMSRQCLRPGRNIYNSQHCLRQLFPYSVSLFPSKTPARFQHTLRAVPSVAWGTSHTNSSKAKRLLPFLMKGATVAGVGLGLASLNQPPIQCDAPGPASKPPGVPEFVDDRPPPPSSSVSLYELGFGTVAGLCAGIFVKKGAIAVGWFLGGIFVLLQYLGSASVIRVDWRSVGNKFENLFYTKDASGATKPPNLLSLWNWMINFLTADFQPRASFIAGFALGLRIG